MNKIALIFIIVVVVIVAIVIVATNNAKYSAPKAGQEIEIGNTTPVSPEAPAKEFAMASFTEIVDGNYKPQFSLKEITVKKGDKVRIKVTVTSGAHDFKIDEFGVYIDTKELNQAYVVEFVADKAGEFIYYCTKPGHRENGQWGTLRVIE